MIHVAFITFIFSVSLGIYIGKVKTINETIDSLNHASLKLHQCHEDIIKRNERIK
jgi:hypothetical protein